MCKHEGCSLECQKSTCLLVARVLFAVILITHGWAKLMGPQPGMEGFTAMLAGMNFPMPMAFAWIVALLETVGGAAILLGVWTEKVAMLVAIQFLVIIFYVKKLNFQKSELDMAILALSLIFASVGAGSYAMTKSKTESMPAR